MEALILLLSTPIALRRLLRKVDNQRRLDVESQPTKIFEINDNIISYGLPDSYTEQMEGIATLASPRLDTPQSGNNDKVEVFNTDVFNPDHSDNENEEYEEGPPYANSDDFNGEYEEGPPYANEKSRVVLHKVDDEKGCLALLITEKMVSNVQDVIDDSHKIQKHEKDFAKIKRVVSAAEVRLDAAKYDLSEAQDEEESDRIQQIIDKHESTLNDACQRRDNIQRALKIIHIDLDCSTKASQEHIREALVEAGLLQIPEQGAQDDAADNASCSDRSSHTGNSGGTLPCPEDLLARATYEKLITLSRDLTDAQRLFEDREINYDREEVDYNNCVANGDEVPSKSEFDRRMLFRDMRLTRYILDTEKAYDNERQKAIDLGIIGSRWGTPSEYGSEAAESSPENDIARAATLSYVAIEAWIDMVPFSSDEMASEATVVTACDSATARNLYHGSNEESTSDSMVDIDEWDAKTIEISDSISVAAFDTCNSKNIRRWQEMTGHR